MLFIIGEIARREKKMIHYIKFEIKNTFSYSIGMIVGGLLPLLLAIGGYHSTGNSVQNKVAAETLFATCLPMIPLGLVMLPFTISFAKDNESGISKRFFSLWLWESPTNDCKIHIYYHFGNYC